DRRQQTQGGAYETNERESKDIHDSWLGGSAGGSPASSIADQRPALPVHLERILHRAREVIAVAEEVEAAGAEEIDVAQLERPGVAIGELDREVHATPIAHVIAERERGVAAHVVGEGEARLHVHIREDVVVVETA